MDQFTMVSTPWWWSSKTRRTGMRSTTPARRGSRRHLGWSLKTQGLDLEVRSLRRCPASSTSPPSWSTISHTALLRLFITRWSGYYDTTLHQGGALLGHSGHGGTDQKNGYHFSNSRNYFRFYYVFIMKSYFEPL